MEELNCRNYIHKDSDHQRILFLLYALSCFLPGSSKIMVNILIRILEIMDLLQQRNTTPYPVLNDRPTIEEGFEKLKQEPHLQSSPEMMQMISMIEMLMKFLQMKDLMDAIEELGTNTSDTTTNPSSPFDGLKNMDPELREAILPPEYSGMLHMFQEMMQQNNSAANLQNAYIHQEDCNNDNTDCEQLGNDSTGYAASKTEESFFTPSKK